MGLAEANWGEAKGIMKHICGSCVMPNCEREFFQFHHIDGNNEDDTVENIVPVCQICHDLVQRELSIIKTREIALKLKKLAERIKQGDIKSELTELQHQLKKAGNTITNSPYKPDDIKRARAAKARNYISQNPHLTSQTSQTNEQITETRDDKEHIITKEICERWITWQIK